MSDPLRARIETARTALREAERRLGDAIKATSPAPRAHKTEVSPAVRAAFSKLRAARAKLEHLEGALTVANLDAARAALGDAERELDRAVDRIHPAPRSKKAWADLAVEGALEKLRIARQTLADLDGARVGLEDPDDDDG